MNLRSYCDAWQPAEDGVWRAPTVDFLSYPSDGNEDCFKVEEQSFWFRHRNKVITGLVANFPPRDVFFDVGGGNGFVAKAIQDAGYMTVLVEPGGGGVANAKRRGVANVVQSMWTPELINSESASAVGLFDVVEHIDDDLQFLKGVHRTLEVQGLVFITVPAYRLLWSYEDVYAGHFRRYRLPPLRRLLSHAGFKVEFSTLGIFTIRGLTSTSNSLARCGEPARLRFSRMYRVSIVCQLRTLWSCRPAFTSFCRMPVGFCSVCSTRRDLS